MTFKRLVLIPMVAMLLALSAPAQAAEYKIDHSHTFIEFKVIHLGFSWLNGRFDDFEGSFSFDPKAGPDAQKINLTIDTASINSNHAERDKHLRSGDFLNVEKFPKATFVSTGYSGDASGGTLSGDFTLMGVTKPIEITVKKIGEGKDPWGGYRAGFEGTATFDRRDFGMGYDLGPKSNDVHLNLYLEGIRQ